MEGDVEGLIHISEVDQEPQDRLEEKYKIGDQITAKVVKVDCEERKIALSVREYVQEDETKNLEAFNSAQGEVDQSLGRVAQDKEPAAGQETDSI